MTAALGRNGLPVYAVQGLNDKRLALHDLAPSREITWWSPGFNHHIQPTAIGTVALPFSDERMFPPYPPGGVDDDDARLTAVFQGALTLPEAGVVTFRVAADDDVYVYLDGSLVLALGGVHPLTDARQTVPVTAGSHIAKIFYADRQSSGAALRLAIEGSPMLKLTPLAPRECSTVAAARPRTLPLKPATPWTSWSPVLAGATAAEPALSPSARAAYDRLRLETGSPWRYDSHQGLSRDDTVGLPRAGGAASRKSLAGAALTFLSRYKDFWGMEDPAVELTPFLDYRSPYGSGVVKFSQKIVGLQVFDAQVMVNFDSLGEVYRVDSEYVPGLATMSRQPQLTRERASAIAAEQPTRCRTRFGTVHGPVVKAPVGQVELGFAVWLGAVRVNPYLVFRVHRLEDSLMINANSGEVVGGMCDWVERFSHANSVTRKDDKDTRHLAPTATPASWIGV